MRRRGRCPQVARWVRMDACKSCAEFGAVPRLRSGLVPSECPLARTLLADVYVKCLGGRKTRIPASEDGGRKPRRCPLTLCPCDDFLQKDAAGHVSALYANLVQRKPI